MENTQFKHKPSGIIYACRKDAIKVMGTYRYRKALAKREFIFNYIPTDGEVITKTLYSQE